MKVITYNVLDGFIDSSDRKKRCATWLDKEAPDILFLNELNGFTEDTLKEFAKNWGHDHSELLIGRSRYLVGITSKYPITDVSMYYEELKGHGAIFSKINGINCIATHLHPHSVENRRLDLDFLLSKISKLLDKNEQVIFGGDFNSFYSKESAYYEDENNITLEWFRYRANRDEKFMNLNNDHLDFSVIDKLSNYPLYDLLSFKNNGFSKSTSTVLCQEKRNADTMFKESGMDAKKVYGRIDYIWTTKELKDSCTSCHIPLHTEVENISDHYPIVATFSNIK